MKFRFVIDAQLPPGLAAHLTGIGHSAEHVNYIGLEIASDEAIWAYAAAAGAVIVTKDQDFAGMAQRNVDGPQVVWIRLGNTTNRTLWSALEPIIAEVLDGLSSGERLIEIT